MRFSLAFAVIAATATSSRVAAEPYQPTIGQYHPQIILPTVEHDREVALSSYLGRKVLVVHFASW